MRSKKVLSSFCNFSTFPFTIFLLFFSIFTPFPFFLASFFPVGQQKFPGQKSWGGGTLPPASCPPAPLNILNHQTEKNTSSHKIRVFFFLGGCRFLDFHDSYFGPMLLILCVNIVIKKRIRSYSSN